ncbi:MAG: transglycosylase SLT domain-containing protein, partial [Cyanobacteria bacterium NC_groundwater_1444_Ag_S-0.65um_54_12]|nr:transglycosylase SLT domain-containing protein [Cyanobacteria bacterium NC_groundwater_1444_Ag_S-0.65um_54_12]
WRIGGKAALAQIASKGTNGTFGPELLVAAGMAEVDPVKAAGYWNRALDLVPPDPVTEQALYLLATRGPVTKLAAAKIQYLKLLPAGEHSAHIAEALIPSKLAPALREELAGMLMDKGHYGPASRMLRDLPSGLAVYRLARCYWRLGNLTKAQSALTEALRRNSRLQSRVSFTRGEIALGQKKMDEAISHFRRAAKDTGSLGLDALNNLVKTYLRANREGEAAWIDREIIARYPESVTADEARWRALWKAYWEGRLPDARIWAQSLVQRNGTLGVAGSYWLGRLEQAAGRNSAALALYHEVSRRSPVSYYGWRARMRAAVITGRGADPAFAINDGPVQARQLDLRKLLPAGEQAILGSTQRPVADEISDWPIELRILAYLGVVPAAHLPAGNMRAMVAHAQGDHYHGIIWAGDDLRLSHPLGYWPALELAARSRGIDPLFFAALVKQESLFDPESRSWVGAIGLAQLMPFTARWVARQIEGPERSLTDPVWNLRLGAWYLAYTGQVFDHDGILQTAAYNAGVGAAKRWRSLDKGDPEAFIERIPFGETRHYVKKVFGYYWTYCSLYRERAGL